MTVTRCDDATVASVAPWWHTVLVLALIMIGSIASWYQHGLPNARLPGMSLRLSSYLTVLVEEWLLILLVWFGVRGRSTIARLVGGRWDRPREFLRDLGLGIAFVIVVAPLIGLLSTVSGMSLGTTLAAITPKTPIELLAILALSATAGFGEELTFRGYLTRQFTAWTGSPVAGILLQGVAFGAAHGFYHAGMILVVVQGWLLGALARWRGTLRPGMLAHGIQDVLGNLVAFFS
jgi:uncharacterized protein